MTTPNASRCMGCSTDHFPPRLRCHVCGGSTFHPMPMRSAIVAAVSHVHRPPPGARYSHLIEVRAESGLPVLAAADFAPALGSQVLLTQSADGAIGILTTDPKETP